MKVEPRSRTPKPYINFSIVLFPVTLGSLSTGLGQNIMFIHTKLKSIHFSVLWSILLLHSLCAMQTVPYLTFRLCII